MNRKNIKELGFALLGLGIGSTISVLIIPGEQIATSLVSGALIGWGVSLLFALKISH